VSLLRRLFVDQTSHSLIQFIRYGIVVAVAGPIDLGGYIVLKASFHIYYVLAATISFTASLVVNYLLSVAWVWTNHTGRQRHVDATIFILIGIVGLGITDLVVYWLTSYAHLNYIVSKLVAFIVVFFWSFGARHYLFKTKIKPELTEDLTGI